MTGGSAVNLLILPQKGGKFRRGKVKSQPEIWSEFQLFMRKSQFVMRNSSRRQLCFWDPCACVSIRIRLTAKLGE